jgi:ribosomal protein S18 acetylase RimI-like enzyme
MRSCRPTSRRDATANQIPTAQAIESRPIPTTLSIKSHKVPQTVPLASEITSPELLWRPSQRGRILGSLGVAQSVITLHILTVDEWRLFRRLRLEALREAPYAFGSVLDDWQGDKDTERCWRQRITDVPFNVIAELDGRPSGMASGTKPNADGEVELISMWVAPFARGRRVADALVDAVITWARGQRIDRVALDVMESNDRTRAFYRRQGFVDQGRTPDACAELRMLRVETKE